MVKFFKAARLQTFILFIAVRLKSRPEHWLYPLQINGFIPFLKANVFRYFSSHSTPYKFEFFCKQIAVWNKAAVVTAKFANVKLSPWRLLAWQAICNLVEVYCNLHFFVRDHGGSMFFWNVSLLLLNYTGSHPRRQQFSCLRDKVGRGTLYLSRQGVIRLCGRNEQ